MTSALPVSLKWFLDLPEERAHGPFETFADTIYEAGFAGQEDRLSNRVLTAEQIKNVKWIFVEEDKNSAAKFAKKMAKHNREYMQYEYLQIAGTALDKDPTDKTALDLFVASLGWIMHLGRKRGVSSMQSVIDPDKQATLAGLMESIGLSKVNVATFLRILTLGNARDLAVRKMAAFPCSEAKL